MTNAQFLDGLALSGIIPAPLIIFATFVGYLGGGPWGGLALTIGIFLPAFAFPLVGHNFLEKMISHPGYHNFNLGVTAGVIGLIAVTGFDLVQAALVNLPALGIFAASLVLLYRWHAKIAARVVVLGASVLGLLFSLFSLSKLRGQTSINYPSDEKITMKDMTGMLANLMVVAARTAPKDSLKFWL